MLPIVYFSTFLFFLSFPEEGCEIRQLKIEDVRTIHDLYPANDMEAVSVFEKLITRLPAYGKYETFSKLKP